jgi:hypothetical protein
MWFLHIIPKNSYSSTVYSRLRPTQTYRLRSSHYRSSRASNADSVFLEVDAFTSEEVVITINDVCSLTKCLMESIRSMSGLDLLSISKLAIYLLKLIMKLSIRQTLFCLISKSLELTIATHSTSKVNHLTRRHTLNFSIFIDRLQWEEVGIYHIKSNDRTAHERLIEQGCKYGKCS